MSSKKTAVDEYINLGTVYATNFNEDLGEPNRPGCSSTSPTADYNFRQWGDTIVIHGSRTISSPNSTGFKGEICYDNNFLYICVADNIWKRCALTSWINLL